MCTANRKHRYIHLITRHHQASTEQMSACYKRTSARCKGILELPIYFYRDKDMCEIDLLIEDSGTLYPLEMKKHADPSKKDIDAFSVLDKIAGVKRGPGGVICLYDKLVTLQGNDKIIPVCYL